MTNWTYLAARARSRERKRSVADVLEGCRCLFMEKGVLTVMKSKTRLGAIYSLGLGFGFGTASSGSEVTRDPEVPVSDS
jgi:hypothetical protein